MYKTYILLLLFIPVISFSQINTDFESRDLSSWEMNPENHWEIDTLSVISGQSSLHHSFNDSVSTINYISYPIGDFNLDDGLTIWRFKIKYINDPSSGNNFAVYLTSNLSAQNITEEENTTGYVVGVNYTGNTDFIKLWKSVDGTKFQIINTNYNWQDSITTDKICAFEISRTSIGDWKIKIDTTNSFDNLIEIGEGSNSDLSDVGNFVVRYKYSSTAHRKLWVDDVSVSSTAINTNDNNSVIVAPQNQVEASGFSSLLVSSELAKEVFNFTVKDIATSDFLPTKITQLTIKAGENNNSNWNTTIQSILLKDNNLNLEYDSLKINDTSITVFFNNPLEVLDGDSANISLLVFLNEGNIEDNSTLQFKINATSHDCLSSNLGSGFAEVFSSDIVSNIFTLEVSATKISADILPDFVPLNYPFSIKVALLDTFNNLDIDFSSELSISKENGVGIISSTTGLNKNVENGYALWNDLTYNELGSFSLLIKDVSNFVTPLTTASILCKELNNTVFDDFSDDNIFLNPQWRGDVSVFSVNIDKELFLFANFDFNPSPSYLSTDINPTYNDTLEWQLYTKLDFDPSSSNYVNWYLMSNNSDLTSGLNGYFLKIGGESGTNDALELYRQDSLTKTLLCRGADGIAAENPNLAIKIIRTPNSEWKIYVDTTNTNTFEFQASIVDTSYNIENSNIGIQCNYTASNSENKFLFDDIYAGVIRHDTTPPSFVNLEILDSLNVLINFDEGLNSESLLLSNFEISNNTVNTIEASFYNSDISKILIKLNTPLIEGEIYPISISNISDAKGNFIYNTIIDTLYFYYGKQFDIVVNEIFADYSPVINLPEAEFLEIYNKSNKDINLKDWKLKLKSSESNIELPDFTFNSGQYLIITDIDNINLFIPYGNVLGVDNFSLNNESQITLKNSRNTLIHSVSYLTSWYNDDYKDNGGWSLEMIDYNNPCATKGNWEASKNENGGTPGKENSVYDVNIDNISPELNRAILISKDSIKVYFDETINCNFIDKSNFTIDNNIGNPIKTICNEEENNTLILVLNDSISENIIYTLTISSDIQDCVGNALINNSSCRFGISETPKFNDIVINEVLFDPYSNGIDFIEIYNRTNKIFDLKNIKIATKDDNNELKSVNDIFADSYLVFPEEYYVLSEDANIIKEQYICENENNFVDISDMPTYANDEGEVVLCDKILNIIDDFEYNADMHYQLLDDVNGVSLERINFERATNDKNNWMSASQVVGFATPSFKNSQFSDSEPVDESVSVVPETFSPDGDSYNDFVNIHYNLSEVGFSANITIYDSKGRFVKYIAKKELLSKKGTFIWDGITEDNIKARIGIYIIYVELFNPLGEISQYKKVCVLANGRK